MFSSIPKMIAVLRENIEINHITLVTVKYDES